MSDTYDEPLDITDEEVAELEKHSLPAVVKGSDPVDIFKKFDALDDEAIVAELEGKLVDVACYHFNQGGKELWGVGKVGVDWAVNELALKGYVVRDESVTYNIDPTDQEYVLFVARVCKALVGNDGREAQVDAAIGTKRQWVKMLRRDGTTQTDPFWFEKGSQKAIRNARLRLISEDVKAKIISLAKQAGKVREVVADAPNSRAGGRRAAPAAKTPLTPASPTRPEASPAKSAPEPSASKFFLLDAFAKAKANLGRTEYYDVLGDHGFTHANEIPNGKRPNVLDALRNRFREIEKEAEEKSAETEDAFLSDADEGDR
jgi:hypothetical protein